MCQQDDHSFEEAILVLTLPTNDTIKEDKDINYENIKTKLIDKRRT